MARWKDYYSTPKALAASGTTTFASNEIPAPTEDSSLIAAVLTFTDANQALDTNSTLVNLSRVKVLSDGKSIFDFDPSPVYLQFCQKFFSANPLPNSAAVSLYIPFNWIDLERSEGEDVADLCAFPLNTQPSIQCTASGTWGAATLVTLGLVYSTIVPKFSSALLSGSMNGANSGKSSQKTTLSEAGMIRAIALPVFANGTTIAAGFSRHRVVLSGTQKVNLPTFALFAAGQPLDPFVGTTVPASLTVSNAVLWEKLVGMLPAKAGSSYIESDCGTDTTAQLAAAEYALWVQYEQAQTMRRI